MTITVRDLAARYGAREVFAGVTFAVEPGAVFALVGRNGAGKSTLVRTVLGQRRADAGEVRIDGRDPWSERVSLLSRIGATPETPDAPPQSTLAEIERWSAPLYPQWDRPALRDRLERFAVPTTARFGELSRGQRALAQLALALAPRPDLLILDDPTLGLDAVARRFFFDELIGELAERGVTVFVTSHDLAGIERIATHVGILHQGRLVDCAPLDELRERATAGGVEPPTLEEIFVDSTTGGEER